jgi:hypothetical protein
MAERNRPTGAPKDPMPQELSDSDYRTHVRLTDLAGKYGGSEGLEKKIEKLVSDNAEYRQTIKELEAKSAQVPEGAVVLTGDDAAKWEKAKALDLDKVVKDAAEAETLRGEIAKRDKAEKRRAAAEAEGVNEKALSLVAGADALEYDTGEEPDPTDASKKVPAGYVLVDGKKVRLAQHVKDAWPGLADALLAKQAPPGNGITITGATFGPESRAGGGGARSDGPSVAAAGLANQRAAQAPNPLRPKAATT